MAQLCTGTLFLGYSSENMLSFCSFQNTRAGEFQITAYQETGSGLSGAAYFDTNGDLCGIHSRSASSGTKTGIYFYMMVSLIIHKLIKQEDVSQFTIFKQETLFQKFTINDAFNEFDEGENRGYCLGKNPNVAKDELGGSNIVCQEVLYRWAIKGKAKYAGVKTDKKDWINDWKNWYVSVTKEVGEEREWVNLDEINDKKRAIQMGHRVSAVSFFVYGADIAQNKIMKKEFKEKFGEKTQAVQENKKSKYNTCYQAYKKPGHQNLSDEDSLTNRKFMYAAENYRFEYDELNEKNGGAEGQAVIYGDAPETIAFYKEKRRTLDKSNNTTAAINTLLETRQLTLIANINANYQKFKKK